MIENNYVDAVIQLPTDLFFGNTIATCIIVLKKSKKDNAILFVDASEEYIRSGTKNRLSPANQQKVLDAYIGRQDIEKFSRLVASGEIADNNYSLTVSAYVDSGELREAVNIETLNDEIAKSVLRQSELRKKIDAIVEELQSAPWAK